MRRLTTFDPFAAGMRAVLTIIVVIAVCILAGIALSAMHAPSWVDQGAFYFVVVAGSVALTNQFWLSAAKQITATAVRHGLCGSCGYSLECLEPEADGNIVCPECGAAWNPARIIRPHWKSASFREIERRGRWSWLGPARFGEDDQGAVVTLLDWRLHNVLRHVGVPMAELDAAREDLRRQGRPVRLAVLGVIVALLMLAMLELAATSDPFVLELAAATALVVLGGMWVIHRSMGTMSRRTFCEVVKRHGMTPCCGARLEGELDEFGCVTCQGCGAKWKPVAGVRKA